MDLTATVTGDTIHLKQIEPLYVFVNPGGMNEMSPDLDFVRPRLLIGTSNLY